MLRSFSLLLFLLSTFAALKSQDTLRVGVIERPPYAMQDEDGNWYGMGVQLWRHVAEAQQLNYTYRAFDAEDNLADRLAGGEIDVALFTTLNPAEEARIDFLQAYHRSSLGVARPKTSGLKRTITGLFSLQFLYIVLGLSALLLMVGVIIYFVERAGNDDQFGGERSLWQGIGSGFWWAGVTMTTIGYGDKAPRTLPGRAIAMLWMLVALAVTSSLTAAIISATSRPRQLRFPEDLRSMEVGVVEDSPAADYLYAHGQRFRTFPETRAGLEALAEKEVEAFVDDETTLRYVIEEYSSLAATIDKTDAEIEAYAFAVRQDSDLREPLGQEVIQISLTEMWREISRSFNAMKQRNDRR